MDGFKITLIVFACISVLSIIYCVYQLIRNEYTYKLVSKWTDQRSYKYSKYSYEYIMDAKMHNWYGLKFPRDKDYE